MNKKNHIVKHQDIQKELVPTLLNRLLLVINYVSFRTNYLPLKKILNE